MVRTLESADELTDWSEFDNSANVEIVVNQWQELVQVCESRRELEQAEVGMTGNGNQVLKLTGIIMWGSEINKG